MTPPPNNLWSWGCVMTALTSERALSFPCAARFHGMSVESVNRELILWAFEPLDHNRSVQNRQPFSSLSPFIVFIAENIDPNNDSTLQLTRSASVLVISRLIHSVHRLKARLYCEGPYPPPGSSRNTAEQTAEDQNEAATTRTSRTREHLTPVLNDVSALATHQTMHRLQDARSFPVLGTVVALFRASGQETLK